MVTKKEALLAACVVVLISYGFSRAESQENNAKAGIVFNDSSHASYFKYQSFLTQHGESGYSAQAWDSLPELERSRKVADGEAFLKKLHEVLLSKGTRSAGEQELLASVWGTNAAPVNLQDARANLQAARMAAVAKDYEERVAERARKIRESADWGAYFDGSSNRIQGVSVVNAAGGNAAYSGYSGNQARSNYSAPTNPTPEAQPYPAGRLRMLPTGEQHDDAPPANETLPIAAGVLVVAGASAAYAMRRRAAVETVGVPVASPVEVQLSALRDMTQDPQRMYDFLRDPSAYSQANNASFDPEVVKMVHSALSQHEQDIASLVFANKYRTMDSKVYMAGSTAEAVVNLVTTAAAVVVACAAVAA